MLWSVDSILCERKMLEWELGETAGWFPGSIPPLTQSADRVPSLQLAAFFCYNRIPPLVLTSFLNNSTGGQIL